MSNQTLTVQQLQEQLNAAKEALKAAKMASKTKTATPVAANIHIAESGKTSIKVAQGIRAAYLNAAQVKFILDNADSMKQMIASL